MTLLSVAEAAAVVGVHKRTFEKHVLGQVPSIRIGRRVKIDEDTLRSWLKAQESLREKT